MYPNKMPRIRWDAGTGMGKQAVLSYAWWGLSLEGPQRARLRQRRRQFSQSGALVWKLRK